MAHEQSDSTVAIRLDRLTKQFPGMDRPAVDGVTFEVQAGEVYALLGPNGAGKTTTVEMLEGLRPPSSGSCRVLGFDPFDDSTKAEMYSAIGVVLQELGAEPFLNTREVLTQYSQFYPAPLDVERVLSMVGLDKHATRSVSKLSGGLRRRLDVAIGLIGDPKVLFLDEPTVGFDPAARRDLWDTLGSLIHDGLTILLTTHDMEEAQTLATRIGIMVRGQLVSEGTVAELRESFDGKAEITFVVPNLVADTLPLAAPGWTSSAVTDGHVTQSDVTVTIQSDDVTRDLHAISTWALERDISLASLQVAPPSLEAVYLREIGRETT